MSNIIKSIITENEKNHLKQLFHSMDSDADGYLDYHEMKASLQALGFTVKKSYVLAIMRMYDKHGCNTICFEDFNYVGVCIKLLGNYTEIKLFIKDL